MNLVYNVDQTSGVSAPLMSNMETTSTSQTAVPMAMPVAAPMSVPVQPVASAPIQQVVPAPMQQIAPPPMQPQVTSHLDYLMKCWRVPQK